VNVHLDVLVGRIVRHIDVGDSCEVLVVASSLNFVRHGVSLVSILVGTATATRNAKSGPYDPLTVLGGWGKWGWEWELQLSASSVKAGW
jgi:hypothetical protein